MGNFNICSHSILSWSATLHQQSNTHVRLLNHRSKTNLFVCQALKLLGSHKRFSFAALKTKYRWLKVGSGKSIMIKLVLCFRLQKDLCLTCISTFAANWDKIYFICSIPIYHNLIGLSLHSFWKHQNLKLLPALGNEIWKAHMNSSLYV